MTLLQKPIGLLGGTFDPVHLGHVQAAKQVWPLLPFEKILFIPCYQPALRAEPMASPEARLAMLSIALKPFPDFEVDDREIRRKSISYMVDTLQSLKADYPRHPLCLILGKDALAKLDRWHQWGKILTLAHLIVIHRADPQAALSPKLQAALSACSTKHINDLTSFEAGKIFTLEIDPILISATQIRDAIQQGESVKNWLNPEVEHYIEKQSIYKTTHQSFLLLKPDMTLCQTDYPLDWYQEDFIPYAEEYLKLPDRKIETVLRWMKTYLDPALKDLGDSLLLLAHYYMGGEIVKLIESFGGTIGDSYQLALMAAHHPEKKIIVESAVHFMAETICILAESDQRVFITNPKAGCTMEMYSKDDMVGPALDSLNERYGNNRVLPICYMNTSGRIKAMVGAQGGAVCTSSNVEKIFRWAAQQNKKILFIPDRNMGENAAHWAGIPPEKIAYWPGGNEGAQFNLFSQNEKTLRNFDEADLVIFSSLCSVHDYYRKEMVKYWQKKNFSVLVHPECRPEVVQTANGYGSTRFLWDYALHDRGHTGHYAIATENHFVQNLKLVCASKGITVVNVADMPLSPYQGMGCGCATMSRNDPPHLVAMLDLLRKDRAPEYNAVQAGDIVNEFSGKRTRLNDKEQQPLIKNARKALEKMIEITEGKGANHA